MSSPSSAAGPAVAAPRVSVVVVNYNGADGLSRCLEALIAEVEPSREVLVVDNASTDASRSLLVERAAREPTLRILLESANLGYSGAVNRALPECRGEYVAVLNMDVEAEPGWLAPLVVFLEEHPEVGAVNPLVVVADGRRINAAGQDVHVTGLGFNRWLGRPRDVAGQEPMIVSGIQGAAFLIRREILEGLGGMDASGFLYHEDVELSWRLRMAGFELYCVPGSVVRHDYFLSMYPGKLHLLERNRWAMLATHLGRATLVGLAPFLVLTEVLVWIYALGRGPKFVAAKASAIAWILGRRRALGRRRREIQGLRRVPDRCVLRRLRLAYSWRQFLVLGRERGLRREAVIPEPVEKAKSG